MLARLKTKICEAPIREHLLVALFVLCSGKAVGFNDIGMDGRVRFL